MEALISDFGLAKDMKMKERTLSQVGSVDWMAPEVIMGKSVSTLKIEIYNGFNAMVSHVLTALV